MLLQNLCAANLNLLQSKDRQDGVIKLQKAIEDFESKFAWELHPIGRHSRSSTFYGMLKVFRLACEDSKFWIETSS